jgi:hypothetical protein
VGFRGDVLVVESERDNVVPHAVIASYLSACTHARSLTYRVLAGADHGLSEEPWRSAYTALLVGWLDEMTAGLRGRVGKEPPARAPVLRPGGCRS